MMQVLTSYYQEKFILDWNKIFIGFYFMSNHKKNYLINQITFNFYINPSHFKP